MLRKMLTARLRLIPINQPSRAGRPLTLPTGVRHAAR